LLAACGASRHAERSNVRCSLCSHAKRSFIEAEADSTSIEAAAEKFGVSERALAKHLTAHPRATVKATKSAPVLPARRPQTRPRATSPAPEPADDAPPPTSRSPVSKPMTARANVHELLVALKRVADDVNADDDASVADRLAVLRASVAPLKLLGQLTGELGASETTVATSPHYRRIRSAIVEALRPFPDATRAVAEALAHVERGPVADVAEAAE